MHANLGSGNILGNMVLLVEEDMDAVNRTFVLITAQEEVLPLISGKRWVSLSDMLTPICSIDKNSFFISVI
jgi:hypothetical protein